MKDKQKRVPERTCIGCYRKKNKSELLRIVCDRNGEINLDRRGRLQGRGAYVCDDAGCMERLIKRHSLNRAFHREITAEQYKKLEEQFDRK